MLITELKNKEELNSCLQNKKNVFAMLCYGCKELVFPYEEIKKYLEEADIKFVTMDYICNQEYSKKYIGKYIKQITDSDSLIIFSCGVGIQSLSTAIYNNTEINSAGKQILAGCDTIDVSGFQGLASPDIQCGQCGTCYLNSTAVICPIKSCSKSLLNGQCGGCKNGKCEVDKNMDCGWDKIFIKCEKLKTAYADGADKIQLHHYKI